MQVLYSRWSINLIMTGTISFTGLLFLYLVGDQEPSYSAFCSSTSYQYQLHVARLFPFLSPLNDQCTASCTACYGLQHGMVKCYVLPLPLPCRPHPPMSPAFCRSKLYTQHDFVTKASAILMRQKRCTTLWTRTIRHCPKLAR